MKLKGLGKLLTIVFYISTVFNSSFITVMGEEIAETVVNESSGEDELLMSTSNNGVQADAVSLEEEDTKKLMKDVRDKVVNFQESSADEIEALKVYINDNSSEITMEEEQSVHGEDTVPASVIRNINTLVLAMDSVLEKNKNGCYELSLKQTNRLDYRTNVYGIETLTHNPTDNSLTYDYIDATEEAGKYLYFNEVTVVYDISKYASKNDIVSYTYSSEYLTAKGSAPYDFATITKDGINNTKFSLTYSGSYTSQSKELMQKLAVSSMSAAHAAWDLYIVNPTGFLMHDVGFLKYEYTEVENVLFKDNPVELELGKQQKIEYSVLPANATRKTPQWSSSDTSIVVVDNSGNIEGKSIGSAIIAAACDDKVYEVSVKVYKPAIPTQVPTQAPTQIPTKVPTMTPTNVPTQTPSSAPVDTTAAEVSALANFRYDLDKNSELVYVRQAMDDTMKITERYINGKWKSSELNTNEKYNPLIGSVTVNVGAKVNITGKVITKGKGATRYDVRDIYVNNSALNDSALIKKITKMVSNKGIIAPKPLKLNGEYVNYSFDIVFYDYTNVCHKIQVNVRNINLDEYKKVNINAAEDRTKRISLTNGEDIISTAWYLGSSKKVMKPSIEYPIMSGNAVAAYAVLNPRGTEIKIMATGKINGASKISAVVNGKKYTAAIKIK